MEFLMAIIISNFMFSNRVSAVFIVNAYYSFYMMMGEGFDAHDGQKNWVYVRDNPTKTYTYQESEEYAKELKELAENSPNKVGARLWAIEKNRNLDYNILVNVHNFTEDGARNWVFVNCHWNDKDEFGDPLKWNSWIGVQYANYIYYTGVDPTMLMGVTVWLERKYQPMINHFIPF